MSVCLIILCFDRNSEKSQRSQLDLCVVVFRTRNPANPEVGRLVEHSKRQVCILNLYHHN